MMLGNILLAVGIGVLIYMMIKGGGCCGGHDHGSHEGRKSHGNTGDGKLPQKHHHGMEFERNENITEKDPVCGMEVHGARIESSHFGKTFHFCSEQCRKLFNLNPNKYAGV